MIQLNEKAMDTLAAEYVLGTLRHGARRRFQQLLISSPLWREKVSFWEQRLNDLSKDIQPVQPDAIVWQRVERQLGFVKTPDQQAEPTSRVIRPRFWHGLSFLATAACLVMAVLLWRSEITTSRSVTELAVIQNQQNALLWLIEVGAQGIDVQATVKLAQRADRDYQLWIVPDNQQAPIPIALMPQRGSVRLDPALFRQANIAVLAVSLEPVGGSPNGVPTEVLYTSSLTSI